MHKSISKYGFVPTDERDLVYVDYQSGDDNEVETYLNLDHKGVPFLVDTREEAEAVLFRDLTPNLELTDPKLNNLKDLEIVKVTLIF